MGGWIFSNVSRMRCNHSNVAACNKKGKKLKKKLKRTQVTMPSRKFSVNSQFSTSSQKTFTSSNGSSINGYRRTASMHQINELYNAINDLITPPHRTRKSPSHDSVSLCKSDVTQSQSNLLGRKSKVSNLRPVRSTSNVSSKSCYASLATNRMNRKQTLETTKSDSTANKSIYSKFVSKFRGKKSLKKEECMLDGKQVQSIDDLLGLMASNEKKKPRRQKIQPRKKANSFDSVESNSSVISFDDVSSKLRNWHIWATSLAASQENEARLRAESSLTESTEERFEDDLLIREKTTKPICFSIGNGEDDDDVSLSLDQTADFDASSIDALTSHENEAEEQFRKDKLKLKITKSDSEMKISINKFKMKAIRIPGLIHRHSDIGATDYVKGKASRGISLCLLDEALTGRSASCEQINRMRGSAHDMSKQRVQQWLEDLNRNSLQQNSTEKDDEDITVDKSSSENKDKIEKENNNENDNELPKPRARLPSQPFFYIPNIEIEDNNASLRMIIHY